MNDSKLMRVDTPEDVPLALYGNTRATRLNWLNVAMDLLVSNGVAEVKVLSIGQRLGVSRSSFYWYFKSRKDLLDSLLEIWEQTNTAELVRQAKMPAATITGAVCNVFRCWMDQKLFNHKLDFAVREWARREGAVRRVIDRSDATRIAAFSAVFERYGYQAAEAEVRARILYFMQVGYYALELSEVLDERLKRVENYLLGFTGQKALPEEVEAICAYAQRAAKQ